MKRRGFSLLEIMMVLLILSVFSAIGIQSLHKGKDKAGAQGLAFTISEEMRRTRQEAIARRRPTAFVLPTDGGDSPITRSFYVMDGEFRPRIVRTRNFKSEYAGANIYLGEWNLASGSWSSADLKVTGSKWSEFDFNKWVPAGDNARKDNCFVFLPDGTVRTNGIKSYDSRYHVLISAGSVTSGNRASARLEGAGESYTISVSPVGGITLSSGIFGENGSAKATGTYASTVNFSAPSPEDVTPIDPVPLPDNPALFPTPNPSTIPAPPPGEQKPDALITKDQYVSLHMEAKSPSGEQLYCAWKIEDSPPGKKGAFSLRSDSTDSQAAGGRMEWDQSLNGGAGAWKTDWQWRPPVNAEEGEKYKLRCEVQNVNGGEPQVEIKRFEIKPPGRILFESNRAIPGPGIYTMDESGQRERPYLLGFLEPSATMDGGRIVCVNATTRDLVLHTPMDPTNNVTLYSGDPVHFPSISPNGNMVAFYRDEGGVLKLSVMKAGKNASVKTIPSAEAPPPPQPWDTVKLAWTANGRFLLYPQNNMLRSQEVKVGGGGQADITSEGPTTALGGANSFVSSATETSDGIIITDNYGTYPSGGYDPWITKGGGARLYLSVGDEDASVERNPRGGEFMITHRRLVDTDRQLHKVPLGTPARQGALTSAGSNYHPVWTK